MQTLDWIILLSSLTGIICYGVYKSRSTRNLEGYFLANRNMPWYLILFSIMGTQASAVTFLTGPGQAYSDGMRFLQYYFGLPLAMIVIARYFVPVYNKLKVYTAYEFLEKRFDAKTRLLTSLLFLFSRALSTGVSIYAPSLVLSAIMGWNIYLTNLVMGGFLIVYTMSGGARAVAHTQKLQMIIVFVSLFLVGYLAVHLLPGNMGFKDALMEAGTWKKMNIISTGMKDGSFDWKDKYNIWSGLIGGFFLSLSYFGTDHSQVGRYLTAKNNRESKLGLLMNGIVKVPMQFFILLIGLLIFSFYLHYKAPVFFDANNKELAAQTSYGPALTAIEQDYRVARDAGQVAEAQAKRKAYGELVKVALDDKDITDNNYVFLHFVKENMPAGLVGLIFAVIFLAAWGSIAAALNALAACSVVDVHKRFLQKGKQITEEDDYRLSKRYTLFWGIFCILVAMFAQNIGNSLIEAVNIIGSLFYGVILGIFLVAFWIKWVGGKAVMWAALIAETMIIVVYQMKIISFLWLNVLGALLVILLGISIQKFLFGKNAKIESHDSV